MKRNKIEQANFEALRAARIESIRGLAPLGTEIFAVVRHCAPTGALWHFTFHVIKGSGDGHYTLDLTRHIATILDMKLTPYDYLVVSGGGMDIGFAVVDALAFAVWRGAAEDENDPDHDAWVKWAAEQPYQVRPSQGYTKKAI